MGWEKEKYRSIAKELIYRTISFIIAGRICPEDSENGIF